MIRLGGLFPKHLNLNGDFGNLEVIVKQLEWRGFTCEVVPVETAAQLSSDLDFIFVGHGSKAAWAAIGTTFSEMAPFLREQLVSGTPGLSISTGFEEMVRNEVVSTPIFKTLPTRVSKFVVHPDGEGEVLGYVNTDADLPVIQRDTNWICTMLHGPVLAKNPTLLEELLVKISVHAGVQLRPIQESEKAGQLADLIDEVWKLEKELASE